MDIDLNIMEVCCACLTKNSSHCNPMHMLQLNTAEAYTNITGIQLRDDLPNQMCDGCIKVLKQSEIFRTKCLASYKWLVKARQQKNKQTAEIKVVQETNIYISIKQEMVENEEKIVIEVPAVNEPMVTVKTEPIDTYMEDDLYGDKVLDTHKNNISVKEEPSCSRVMNRLSVENDEDEIIYKNNSKNNTELKMYKCDLCNFKTLKKSFLDSHTSMHERENFKCAICDYRCASKSALVTHLRTHTGEKPYKCDSCNQCFTQKGSLDRHLRRHTGVIPYKCVICNNSFTKKKYLLEHVKTHTDEKPYKCDICQYSSLQKSNLVHHLKTHSSEKPYKCKTCPCRYKRNSELVQHLKSHTIKKKYKCNKCFYSSNLKSYLVKHLQSHTDDESVKCDSNE